jgi:PTS system mannose-specific IIA component
MSTALFFITHQGIASNMLSVAESILQKSNNNLSFQEIPMDAPVEMMISEIENKISQLKIDDGILFITDIYGSTPGNIAQQLSARYKTELLSGVNLPMIIRLMNYRDEPLQSLITKALEGAKRCIQQHS